MSYSNMYGEEFDPPPPLPNITPAMAVKIERSGILEFAPFQLRDNVIGLFSWLIEQVENAEAGNSAEVLENAADDDAFFIVLEHPVTRQNGGWMLHFELLDERIAYYEVKACDRIF